MGDLRAVCSWPSFRTEECRSDYKKKSGGSGGGVGGSYRGGNCGGKGEIGWWGGGGCGVLEKGDQGSQDRKGIVYFVLVLGGGLAKKVFGQHSEPYGVGVGVHQSWGLCHGKVLRGGNIVCKEVG